MWIKSSFHSSFRAAQYKVDITFVFSCFVFLFQFTHMTVCIAVKRWIEIVKWTTEHSAPMYKRLNTCKAGRVAQIYRDISAGSFVFLYKSTSSTTNTRHATAKLHPWTETWMETSILPLYFLCRWKLKLKMSVSRFFGSFFSGAKIRELRASHSHVSQDRCEDPSLHERYTHWIKWRLTRAWAPVSWGFPFKELFMWHCLTIVHFIPRKWQNSTRTTYKNILEILPWID